MTPDTGPIKLLLADVDGTLVTPEKELTPRSLDSVKHLRAAGIQFAITSGRPPRGMLDLIGQLHITTPVACFNGGMFVTAALEVISESLLPVDIARRAMAMLRDAGLDVWVYSGTNWYVTDRGAPHVDRESQTVRFEPIEIGDFGGLDRIVKIVGVGDDYAAVAAAETSGQQQCGTHASVSRSQPYYLDITHPDANKGMVARRLSEFLSIPNEQIAAIGDMPNDILMFRQTGLSIAMGNAGDKVKAAAQLVTASNREEGFALAVEQFLLPRVQHSSVPGITGSNRKSAKEG